MRDFWVCFKDMRQFDEFNAQSLYCPKCKAAVSVTKKMLLILPNGNLYNYICKNCGKSLGSQTDTQKDINPDFK